MANTSGFQPEDLLGSIPATATIFAEVTQLAESEMQNSCIIPNWSLVIEVSRSKKAIGWRDDFVEKVSVRLTLRVSTNGIGSSPIFRTNLKCRDSLVVKPLVTVNVGSYPTLGSNLDPHSKSKMHVKP